MAPSNCLYSNRSFLRASILEAFCFQCTHGTQLTHVISYRDIAAFNQITPVANPQGRGWSTTRRVVQIINLLLWAGLSSSPCLWPDLPPVQANASERSEAQSVQESSPLELNKPIERELSVGESHFYKITTISGQYLHIVVEQRGIDVAVALVAPGDKKFSEADSEHLIEGSETVSAITEAPGAYLIEARSPEKIARPGRYEIKVEELRVATDEDKYRAAGEAAFREAFERRLMRGCWPSHILIASGPATRSWSEEASTGACAK
jgi:hypothetical protein